MCYKTTLYIPVGIAGTGKTTYANRVKVETQSLEIVSKESVMELLPETASTEDVYRAMRVQAKDFLEKGYSVFFDACNLKEKYRKEIIDELSKSAEYVVGIYFPETTTKKGLRNLDDDFLAEMRNSLESINFGEGFDSIWTVY